MLHIMAIILITYLLAIYPIFCSTSYYPSGSIPCKLYNHTYADCSHRQLSRVPVIHDDRIKSLDLSHNNFKLCNLGGEAHFKRFGLLTTLDLSDNRITNFDDTTFQGLKLLRILDLSNHNVIEIQGKPFKHLSSLLTLDLHSIEKSYTLYCTYSLSHIVPSAFAGLINLKYLDLHCNNIEYLPADIFAELKNLRYLDLSYNALQQVYAQFPASLQTLNISNINVLTSIETDSLKNLTNLVELTLNDGYLLLLLPETPLKRLATAFHVVGTTIQQVFQSMMRFRKIISLNLQFSCELSSLDRFMTYFQPLNFPLEHLVLTRFNCQSFNSDTFRPLAMWNISMTRLAILNSAPCSYRQPLQAIEDLSFSLFTNLQKLTVSNHHLSHLSQGVFNGLIKLQELDLSNNCISFIPQQLFEVFQNSTVKYLDLSNNLLRNIDYFHDYISESDISSEFETIFEISSLEQLNISSNPIEHGISNVPCLCYQRSCFQPNLTVVNMEHASVTPVIIEGKNKFHVNIESTSILELHLARTKGEPIVYLHHLWKFMPNPNLQYVDIRNWFLEYSISDYFGITSNLTYLDISSSNLYDHTQSAVNYSDLETLKVARNGINTTQEIAFLHAPSLTTLDLSHNRITNIHNGYFAMLSNLINLNLEDNRLRSLDWFHDLDKLHQLNIGQNFLSAISKNFLTKIKQLKALNASDNRYDCTLFANCALEPFQSWILQDTFTLLQANHLYHCYFKQNLSFGINSSVSSTNLDYCKYLVPIYICATLVGLLFIGIVMFLFVKYHWHIRYKLFLLLHRRRYRHPLDDEREDEDLDENAQEMRALAPIHYRRYDCYVAYTRHNGDWVNDELVPNIEEYGPEPFSLCMKERGDIPPGRYLLSSICHGIMHSRRTLVVLSEHFMADGMCDFQLHIAQNRLIKEGRDVLILVFLEEIPDAKKTLLLRQILCTNKTVFKWPQDPLGKDLFWRRLRVELKRPVRIDRRFEA